MKNYSWIKMGFKVVKIIMLTVLVVLLLTANSSNKLDFTKKYDFVEIVDMSASTGRTIGLYLPKSEAISPFISLIK